MGKGNKKAGTGNHKKEGERFHSKKIKHDPQAESARAVFGLDGSKEADRGNTKQPD